MSIVPFGSAHRPVDGVDICRELYDHAVSSVLLPDDPFFSMRLPGGHRQTLTYAVMRLAMIRLLILRPPVKLLRPRKHPRPEETDDTLKLKTCC